jgi:preprotein translocase subunit SecA
MLGGKGISAPVKPEGEDGEEHTTVTAQQVDKVKAEYESWHKRLEPVVKVIFEAFWEYPEGQGSDGGEGGVHFGDQPGEISKTDGATERQGGKLRDARALTHELYRRFGSVIEFTAEEQTDKSKAVQKTVHETAVSLVQQRKRVFDLAYDLVEKIVVEYCPEDKTPDDWDIPALQLALKDQFGIAVSLADVNLEVGSLADRGWGADREAHRSARDRAGPGVPVLCAALLAGGDRLAVDRSPEGNGPPARGHRPARLRSEGPEAGVQKRGLQHVHADDGHHLAERSQEAVPGPARSASSGSRLPSKKPSRSCRSLSTRRGGVVLQHQSSATSGAADEKSTRDTSRDDQPEVEGDQTKQKAPRREEPKVGRNEPCPCGSGKKYKKCHGASAA